MCRLSILLLGFFILSVGEVNVFGQDGQNDKPESGAFRVENIALLNPMKEFGQRSPSTEILSGYIKSLESNFTPLANE